jgi:hypothetical protein
MRKRKESDYFDKEGKEGEGRDYDKDFSGAGVTEFGLDLNTNQLRTLSPDELEKYLRRKAGRPRHRR